MFFSRAKISVKLSAAAPELSIITSCKQIRADFKYMYCPVKTHVQTACEPHDLNMEFCSFDNCFKLLCPLVLIIDAKILDQLN